MSKISNAKKKEIAERLFIEEGLNAKTIAEDLQVTQKTVGNWRNAGGWDDRRTSNLAAPHKIKELLLKELQKVAKGEFSNVDADALAKINKVIGDVSDKVNVQVVISVFKEFDNWMADNDPEIAVLFLKWHKAFIVHKATMES
ncbi:MAG: hypothetical protein ACPG6V_05265 [Flavobacteriales bacterium]